MKKWDRVYSKEVFGEPWYPDEGVIKFTARYIQRRTGMDAYNVKRKVKRILDAGCGNGRHSIFFAEQGLNVWGIDISKEAIEVANVRLAKLGLEANLKVGDVEKLPFKREYFDAVVSYGVLDHK